MIDRTILHYHIIKEIGRGGMGVVYLAEDTKLKREVAIKFLPQQISSDKEQKKRFEIEAQAAASLNHPNITTIHAIEESGNDVFIVMEYIDGIELKDKINSDPIPIEEATNIAIQIAEGLEAAHKKGIVHRDIKAQNIMITGDSKVKIMDFGLAKVGEGTQLTKAGSTIGTAAYMSPEQARGEEIDHRTDIWSFGVVLYEMIAGKMPFKGDYEQAVIYSILNEEAELKDNVPEEIEYIIAKALSKKKEERYPSITEMLSDLHGINNGSAENAFVKTLSRSAYQTKPGSKSEKKKWIIPAGILLLIIITAALFYFFNKVRYSGAEEKKMIAVLPFENIGPSENEYFGDGLTEEITSKLSGISGLGVIARQSAMQYKGTTKSIQEIGQELGVSYILLGTVRWENLNGSEHIRVTPQLIDVREGTQIWSQASEKILSGSFKLQSEIAESVIQALDVKLELSEKQTLAADITNNAEAYDYYLRGITAYGRSYNEVDYRLAEKMLVKAIELDPGFSRAFAQLSRVHSAIYWEFFDHTESRVLKAKINADKALELDPNLVEGHLAMGWYYYHCKLEYNNALTEFFYVLKHQVNNLEAHIGIGSIYRRQGKMQEALNFFKKSFEISPVDNIVLNSVAATLILLRKYDETNIYLQKALTITPSWRELYTTEAMIIILKSGDIEKAGMILNNAEKQNIQSETGFDIFVSIIIEIGASNFDKALDLIRNMKNGVCDYQFFYIPGSLFMAETYGLMKNKRSELAYYDSARVFLESKIKESPDDARLYSSLGIAYAGIGEKEKAVRAGKKGVVLLPISKEAWNGYYREIYLAQIYTMVGEYDLAIDKLDYLLSIPGELSVAYIKINPVWKPLFNNRRFAKILEKYK